MYEFQGFIEIDTYANNVINTTSAIGELSAHSATFAKDKGIYVDPTNRVCKLVGFYTKSNTGGYLTPPSIITTTGVDIANWIYSKQTGTTKTSNKNTFLNSFISNFVVRCDYMDCGDFIEALDGNWYPEWVMWKNREYAAEDNRNKIWFSDSAFRNQYDKFEIVVVPPIQSLNLFFGTSSALRIELEKSSLSKTLENIGYARGEWPETLLTTESFDWVNPHNSSDKINTDWTVLIYGSKGNNYEFIIAAITDYIITKTSINIDDWKTILPDIFKRTEFVIIPKWNNYAIPNMTVSSGIYSSIVNISKELAYIKKMLPSYPPAHIDNYACVMPNPYKNIFFDIISNFSNRDNIFEITQLYPDIINVSTTSNDFNRMSARTQSFLQMLSNVILVAETLDSSSSLPIGYRRTMINNTIYVSLSHEKIQYLIACKSTTSSY